MDPRTLLLTFQVLKLCTLWRQVRVSAPPELVCEDLIVLTLHVPLSVVTVIPELALKVSLTVLENLMSSRSVFLTPGIYGAEVFLLPRQGLHQQELRAAHHHHRHHHEDHETPCHLDIGIH